jgi:hypothetical protein
MDGQRARTVVRKSPYRTVGRFFSWKRDAEVQWESALERDFIHHLEYSEAVIKFREQPITVQIPSDGRQRRYTPDFYAIQDTGHYVYEVKPAHRAGRSHYENLFKAAEEFFGNHGYRYRVVTEQWIRREPRLENIKILMRYRTRTVSSAHVDLAHKILAATSPLKISDLASELASSDRPLATIYQLIAGRFLKVAIDDEPIDPNSMVWVP